MIKRKFKNLMQDKPIMILLVVLLFLGIFIRVYDFNQVGLWNDDMSTIPTGLLWFYEHDSYPGLSGQGEPAFGNLIVGSGCMLSGEDFSGVEKIVPMFYPGREELFGKELVKAMPYCKAPGILFGILLLGLVFILTLLMLDKYAALITTTFYAFYPPLIQLSTFIHVDIFAYAFIAASLVSLYIFYTSKSNSKKEGIWFILSAIFASLAFGVKLPNAAYIVFVFFILFEKNFGPVKNFLIKTLNLNFEKSENTNPEVLIRNLISGIIASAITLFLIFEFSFRNILAVITKYRAESSTDLATFGLNSGIFKYIYDFFFHANILDVLILLISFYTLIKLIINFKTLHKNEKFLLYLYLLFIGISLTMETFKITRVMILFSFPIILTMGAAISSRFAAIPKKRILLLGIILAYLIIGFTTSFALTPHFISCNPLLNTITPENCNPNYEFVATKPVADKLKPLINEGETFAGLEGIMYYYLQPELSIYHIQFKNAIRQQMGREPTTEDKINYYHPLNKTVRYVVANPSNPLGDEKLEDLLKNYQPLETVYLNKIVAAHIYDLQNLKEK